MDTLGSINKKTQQAYSLAAEKYHSLFHDELEEKEYDRQMLDAFRQKFAPGLLIADLGCGPSAHIGRDLFDKGLKVVGLDISGRCARMAAGFNPKMPFLCGDISLLAFKEECFLGLVAVKAGSRQGFQGELLGIQTEVYFSFFAEHEISGYFEDAGFKIELLQKRNPYAFELNNERIFALGRKK